MAVSIVISFQRDSTRTAALFSMGYRVLRFWNNEVVENLEAVLEVIRLALRTPHPFPLPAGGEREIYRFKESNV